MCTYVCIFIKVYYISPILYFFRQMISTINTIKFKFILILLLYFKVCFKGRGSIKNSFCFQNQLLQFLFFLYFQNQVLQFLFLFYFQNQFLKFLFLPTCFLANLLLKYLITFLKILLFVFLFLIVFITPFSKMLESSRA